MEKPISVGQNLGIFWRLPPNLLNIGATRLIEEMPEEFIISDDPIINYRNYYANGKRHLHKWTKRNKPEWIDELISLAL